MTVSSISLDGFRNYDREQVCFDPGINVIVGDNAQGKTNLLESIYFLTCGHSFRTRYDREAVNFSNASAKIDAIVESEGRRQRIEIFFGGGRKKTIKVNGVKLRTTAELSGKLNAVLFCPDDLYIIKEGPSQRRKLLDSCIGQLRPRYAAAISAYSRAYDQKSRILRDWREKPDFLELLDEYNDTMCRLSAEIIRYRAYFASLLSEKAASIHRDFSGEREELTVKYKTVSNVSDPFLPAGELYSILCEHQKNHRRAEIESGMCLSGCHKDDLEIFINGQAAKIFASQGQTRTAALSLKLAEREVIRDDKGEYPILLLDDVLSELDAGRQNFVLNRISGGQVLITGCEDTQIAKRTGGKLIYVEKGKIS